MDFVKEGKLEDEIKRRQAEWERVRKPEDPVEAPPEVFDNRTLYEKLKEQHDIKKQEFESQYALKNQVRGIDTDEADFLSDVDRARFLKEKEIRLEERKEVEEVKKALQSKVTSDAAPAKISINVPATKKENKQAGLLAKVVVAKHKLTSDKPAAESAASTSSAAAKEPTKSTKNEEDEEEESGAREAKRPRPAATAAVAGVLPGLGVYDSNSSSDNSDNSDDDSDADLTTGSIYSRT